MVMATVYLFLTPWSMTSCWLFEIDDGRGIYTMDIGKHCLSQSLICFVDSLLARTQSCGFRYKDCRVVNVAMC